MCCLVSTGKCHACSTIFECDECGLQIAFVDDAGSAADSFTNTWNLYNSILGTNCAQPCEQILESSHSTHNVQQMAGRLCEQCGMDTDGHEVTECGVCSQQGRRTVACCSCILLLHSYGGLRMALEQQAEAYVAMQTLQVELQPAWNSSLVAYMQSSSMQSSVD